MVVQLTNLTIATPNSKAGLMFREGTNGGSRHYSILATAPLSSGGPGVIQVVHRGVTDGNGEVLASVPLPAKAIPNLWLKLSQAGTTFAAFASPDGSNWTLVNNHLASGPYTSVLGGLAVTAYGNSPTAPATASFAGWQFLCTPAIGHQPEPASVTIGVLQNVTFSNLAMAATCPASGQVTYQWFKATNVLAGQDSPSLTLYSVNVSDSGTYYAAVTTSSGVFLSMPVTLTVTNALPVVLPETNLITSRTPVRLYFADLLANDHDPKVPRSPSPRYMAHQRSSQPTSTPACRRAPPSMGPPTSIPPAASATAACLSSLTMWIPR